MLIDVQPSEADDFSTRYNVTTLNMAGGLPNNFVDYIYQDSYGFIWMATRGSGLTRFDGYSYLPMVAGKSVLSLKSNSCRNMFEDLNHRLWVSMDEYTAVVDLTTLRTTEPQCADSAVSRRLRTVLAEPSLHVYRDHTGHLWLATQRGIYCIQFSADGTVTSVSGVPHNITSGDAVMRDVLNDGSVMAAFSGQLHKMTINGDFVHDINITAYYPAAAGRQINDIIEFCGHVCIATSDGLVCSDGNTLHKPLLSHEVVMALSKGPGNTLLAGTLGGVDVFNSHMQPAAHLNMQSAPAALASNFVNCILAKNGQVWIGTENAGITKLTPRRLLLDNFIHNPADASSLGPNTVNAMYAGADGSLWVGCVEGGLSVRRKGSTAFTHYTQDNGALPHNSVSVLQPDGHGRVWIGTWGGGLCAIPLAGGATVRLPLTEKEAQQLLFIGVLAWDKYNDGLWIGSNSGLFFYSFRKQKLEEPFQGCRNVSGCVGSLVARDGTLYVGCIEGMVKVYLQSRPSGYGVFAWQWLKNKLDSPRSGIIDKISCFCQQTDGTLWVGSNGYGIYRQEHDSTGRECYRNITERDGLACNVVKGITYDNSGSLWITTAHGLSHYNPRTKVFVNYYEDDGLVSSEFYWNSAVRSPKGIIYLGSDKGVTAIYGECREQPYVGNLRFTGLTVDNKPALAGSDIIDTDISIARRITLTEANKSFAIEFSSLSYGSGSQGVYRYRMRGYEDSWITLPAGEHSVRYSMLPAGSYTFEVQYMQDENPAHRRSVSIEVVVRPHIYKTWWFLLIIAALAGLIIWSRRQLRRRHVSMKAVLRLLLRHAAAIMPHRKNKAVAATVEKNENTETTVTTEHATAEEHKSVDKKSEVAKSDITKSEASADAPTPSEPQQETAPETPAAAVNNEPSQPAITPQQTADDSQQTTDDSQQTADDSQQTADDSQQTTDDSQQTAETPAETKEEPAAGAETEEMPFMEKADSIMERSYSDHTFSIERLAQLMSIKPEKLARRMRKECGMTPGQYIRHFRLEKARRILMQRTVYGDVTQVASQAGFNDPKYFTRCFTREYGIAPSQYSSIKKKNGGKK